MKLWAAMALRITFSTYIVYSSQTATFAKIGRSKSHPKWVFRVFLSQQILRRKNTCHVPSKTQAIFEWRRYSGILCLRWRQAWAQEKTKALRQSREASWWPSRWAIFLDRDPNEWSLNVPCWWCLGWTSDLRLCCGSSSSAVLTGVVVFGSKTSRLRCSRSGADVL